MNINELMEKKEKLNYLENLLSSYNNNDESVYELILKETGHPPVNFFMIETAVHELENKIKSLKKEINQEDKFVDSDVNTKSK